MFLLQLSETRPCIQFRSTRSFLYFNKLQTSYVTQPALLQWLKLEPVNDVMAWPALPAWAFSTSPAFLRRAQTQHNYGAQYESTWRLTSLDRNPCDAWTTVMQLMNGCRSSQEQTLQFTWRWSLGDTNWWEKIMADRQNLSERRS